MYKALGIKGVSVLAYRPESNSVVERMHRDLNAYLRAFVGENRDQWHTMIDFAMFSRNNQLSTSTGYPPSELVFGQKVIIPTILTRISPVYTYDSYAAELKYKLQRSWEIAGDNLQRRKIVNKDYYDAKYGAKEVELAINDPVYVIKHKRDKKLEMPYTDVFYVEKILSPVAIVVRNGAGKMFKVHKNYIKKAVV